MATTYTWKVTTLDHDRALETYLNKANTEDCWEVVFILPAERPGRATVVARKPLVPAAEIRVDASGSGASPLVFEPAPAQPPVVEAAEVTPNMANPERNGRRSGKTASKRKS